MKAGDVVAGRYCLEARLGVGGMGEVWASRHVGTGRAAALKIMHAHVAASTSARTRFSREARVSARIDHPSVIDVLDVGELDDGRLFLVMELLDGVDLGEALRAVPPLSARDLCAVALDTARALAAAHDVGIVHRDVKPANIFLHRDRTTGLSYAKVLDFGISKLMDDESDVTQASSVIGSPHYMSPEQTRSSGATDHRSDLWALGVVLFEGLTGVWPHDGDGFSSLVIAVARTPPRSIDEVAPHLPEPLRAVVRDCLRPVAERIQSAGELVRRLEQVVADGDLAAIPLPARLARAESSKAPVTGLKLRTPPPLTGSGSHAAPDDGLTLSTIAVEKGVTIPPGATPAAPALLPPSYPAPAAPPARARPLDLVALLLGVAAVGIGVAVLVALRGHDAGKSAPASSVVATTWSSAAAASAGPAPPEAAPIASQAPPAASSAPPATPPAPPAASSAPPHRAAAQPPSRRDAPKAPANGAAPSRVDALGSGL